MAVDRSVRESNLDRPVARRDLVLLASHANGNARVFARETRNLETPVGGRPNRLHEIGRDGYPRGAHVILEEIDRLQRIAGNFSTRSP